MLYHNKIMLLVPFLALAISCNKATLEEPVPQPCCHTPVPDSTICASWGPAIGIASITGATSCTTGQTVSLSITVTGRDGCSVCSQVVPNVSGNNITFTGRIYSEGCMCTQVLTDVPTTYSFTPTQPGTYVFHAATYEGTPVTHTITVQ